MPRTIRSKLSYANVMATIAVFVALGGSSYAAIKITGNNVKDGTLTGIDVKNSTLTGNDVRNGSLSAADFAGALPAAQGAQGPQGLQGPQGVPGPKGDSGSVAGAVVAGIVNADGNASPSSTQYSSVRSAQGVYQIRIAKSVITTAPVIVLSDWPASGGATSVSAGTDPQDPAYWQVTLIFSNDRVFGFMAKGAGA
jgi:hypothetical protein